MTDSVKLPVIEGAPRVPYPDFQRAPEAIRSEDSRTFLRAWHRWRGDNLLPRRSDFHLADIKPLLPRLLLLEVRSAREIVFRLAGTMVRARVGAELTGRNFIDLARPEERAERARLLLAEVAQPCGAVMIYPLAYPSGYEAPVEVVSVPVEPNQPHEAKLVLALFTELFKPEGEIPASIDQHLAPGKRVSFFDIGGGVPSITA